MSVFTWIKNLFCKQPEPEPEVDPDEERWGASFDRAIQAEEEKLEYYQTQDRRPILVVDHRSILRQDSRLVRLADEGRWNDPKTRPSNSHVDQPRN